MWAEEFHGTRYQSGSFSLILVGIVFTASYNLFLFLCFFVDKSSMQVVPDTKVALRSFLDGTLVQGDDGG